MKNTVVRFIKNLSPFNNRTDMTKALFIIKKCLAFLFCYWVGLLVAEGVVIMIHFAFGKNPLKGEMFSQTVGELMAYFGYIIPIIGVMLYWRLIEKRRLSELGVNRNVGSWFICGGIGVLLLVICIGGAVLFGAIRIKGISEKPDYLLIMLYLIGFAVQGAVEEFLCRGLVFRSLRNKTGIFWAFAVSTVLFIYPHLSAMKGIGAVITAVAVINLVLISAVFTLVMLRFDSIWAACGLHGLWNFFLMCIFGLDISGNEAGISSIISAESVGRNIVNGSGYGIESSIVTTVVLAVCTAVMWFAWYKKASDERRSINGIQQQIVRA